MDAHVQAATRDTTGYGPTGITVEPTVPAGFRLDTWERRLGTGTDDFDAGCDAIRRWVGHRDGGGFALHPEYPAVEEGTTLAVAVPVGPAFFLATARIVRVVDEARQFGFAYGNLPHHFSVGEESFIIHHDPDDTVWVRIVAVWHTGWWPTRLAPPVTRLLQRRAINRWLDGVQRHVAAAPHPA